MRADSCPGAPGAVGDARQAEGWGACAFVGGCLLAPAQTWLLSGKWSLIGKPELWEARTQVLPCPAPVLMVRCVPVACFHQLPEIRTKPVTSTTTPRPLPLARHLFYVTTKYYLTESLHNLTSIQKEVALPPCSC